MNIGHRLIKSVSLSIGGCIIDSYSSTFLELRYELSFLIYKKEIIIIQKYFRRYLAQRRMFRKRLCLELHSVANDMLYRPDGHGAREVLKKYL